MIIQNNKQMEAGRYRVTGVDVAAGGGRFEVTKMKIKLRQGGVISGKMYYAASGSNPAQKQRINGTWSGTSVKWNQQYRFGSGAVYNYTYQGSYANGAFSGNYTRQDNAKGTFNYNLRKVTEYSSDSE